MKICYTAIIGNYDQLKDPLVKSEGWKYVCFSSENIKSDIWEVIKVSLTDDNFSNVKKARFYKIAPFLCFNKHLFSHSLWLDANIHIIGDLNEFTNPFIDNEITLMKHPHRANLDQECDAIIKYKKDNGELVKNQVRKYKSEGYLCNELAATGIILRKNSSQILNQAMIWKEQVKNFSHRDQLSFNYSCWKSGIKPNYFSYDIVNSHIFKYYLHPHKIKK